MLNIVYKTLDDGVLIVTPFGKIHHEEQTQLYDNIRHNIDSNSARSHVIFNMENLTYISSSGFRVLLLIDKELSEAGGSFVLCSPTNSMKRVLDITGLSKVFNVFLSVNQALESINNHDNVNVSSVGDTHIDITQKS